MLKHLLRNWKTTSAGITAIAGGIVHIVFMVKEKKPMTETDIMVAIGSLLLGVGMLAAGDADKSQSKEEAQQDREAAQRQIDTTLVKKEDVGPDGKVKDEARP